jgi:protease PrsW
MILRPEFNLRRKIQSGMEEKPGYFTASNKLLVAALSLAGFGAVGVSLFTLLLIPLLAGEGSDLLEMENASRTGSMGLSLEAPLGGLNARGESPATLNFTITNAGLAAGEQPRIVEFTGRRQVQTHVCSEAAAEPGDGRLTCAVDVSYRYLPEDEREFYAVAGEGPAKRTAGPVRERMDWRGYEESFWNSALLVAALAALGLAACALVAALMLRSASRAGHETLYPGEYGLGSLLWPFGQGRTPGQAYQSLIVSSPMWLMEVAGIAFLVAYMAAHYGAWETPSALASFLLSGAFSFVLPFLLAAAAWSVDYKEREPLRIIVSLFLWGGFAGILAIGVNSLGEGVLSALGIGFLAATALAPAVEELFKGAGLVILSLHHEFDDMVDGIVYGLAIGAGFSFIENWFYLMDAAPLGGSVGYWLLLFAVRSVMFMASHSVFTATTGAVIGYLKQTGRHWAPYGLFIGILPAAALHALHNLATVLPQAGAIGAIAYIFVIVPVFDYGSLAAITILLLYGIYTAQEGKP